MHGHPYVFAIRQSYGNPVHALQTETLDIVRGKGQVSAEAGVQERLERLILPVAVRDFHGDQRFKTLVYVSPNHRRDGCR